MLTLQLTLALLGIAFKAKALAACWQSDAPPLWSATILSGSALESKFDFEPIISRQMSVRPSGDVASYSLLSIIAQLRERLLRARCAAALADVVNGSSGPSLTSDANIAGASLEVRKSRAKALGQEIVSVFPLRKAVQFFEGPGRSVDPPARRHEV